MQAKSEIQAKPGDVVVVHGHTTGDPGRTGVILEVLGTGPDRALPGSLGRGARICYWPGSDASVRPGSARTRRAIVSRRQVADAMPDGDAARSPMQARSPSANE